MGAMCARNDRSQPIGLCFRVSDSGVGSFCAKPDELRFQGDYSPHSPGGARDVTMGPGPAGAGPSPRALEIIDGGQDPAAAPSGRSGFSLPSNGHGATRHGGPSSPARVARAEAPFRQGDEVVVRRDFGGGYHLCKGQTGRVVHIDADGDALIDFPDDEEQWVHSTMFARLSKVDEVTPIWLQALQLLPSLVQAMVGWSVLAGWFEGVYWIFLDPYNLGFSKGPVMVIVACVLAFLLIDACGLQPFLARHASAVSAVAPMLFTLSALENVQLRCSFLVCAAAAVGWSVAATLGTPPSARKRQLDGWAVPIALVATLTLRWCFATLDIFLTNRLAKIILGSLGVVAASKATCDESSRPMRREGSADQNCEISSCRSCCDCASWPSAACTGLMGGSALAIFTTYLSTLMQAHTMTSVTGEVSYMLGLWSLAALAGGVTALAAVWCMTPWWLDTCQAALVIGLLPLAACLVQGVAGTSVEGHGPVQGTGFLARAGLLALMTVFPFMLALFSKEFSLLAQSRAAGGTLFVAGVFTIIQFLTYFAVLVGGSAPVGGSVLQGRMWPFALGLGLAWSLGVFGAPNGASRPSVHELWYLSRHSGPPKRDYMHGALAILGCVFGLFFFVGLPVRIASTYVRPPAHKDVLVVAGFNAQQGYTIDGWPNVDCVVNLLDSVKADIVGISESNAAHPISANNDVAMAYGTRLHMGLFRGVPGSLPSVDEAVLSRLPFDQTSGSTLEVLMNCDHCPTQVHIWARTRITWNSVAVDVHAVHTEWFSDPASQIRFIAREIRRKFATGPMILVGDFNMPRDRQTRPVDTAMAEMVNGTGLQEAFGALDRDAPLPLPPTELISGLHIDYIFYRDLAPVSSFFGPEACSDHRFLVATFRARPG